MRTNEPVMEVVVDGNLALEILALFLDEVGQDVDVPLIQGRDEVDAERAALELDQHLTLRVGVLRVDADMPRHRGSHVRRNPCSTDDPLARGDDGLMEGERALARGLRLARFERWRWANAYLGSPDRVGVQGTAPADEPRTVIYDSPSCVGARRADRKATDDAAVRAEASRTKSMSEPKEAELKLACDAADLRALQDHPRLKGARSQAEAQLSSVYFDTADQDLRRAGFVLRVREQDGRYVQTAKSAGDGLFERFEWEREVSGPKPDRTALAETPLAEVLGSKARLKSLFTVAVERRLFEVEEGSSLIEVALDHGRIEKSGAGSDAVPITELELELKHGTPSDLFALARALVGDASVRLGVRSKGERGYLLLDGRLGGVRKAEPLSLREDMTAAEAFKAIAHACLRHMRLNEDVLLDHRDPEALHQVRVSIRRLRSAFSLYGDLIRDAQSERLRADLKRLSEPLGRARNLDVFLTKTLPKERARHPDETGLLGLERHLEARRTEAYAEVLATLNSDAWRQHVLDLVTWINAGPWLIDDSKKAEKARNQSAQAFAAGVLEKRRRQVKKRGRDLGTLSPEDRHQVRIAAKKLRYGAEFFGSLYTGKKATKRHAAFVEALSELQDCLGDINDIATGHELLDDLTGTDLKATSAVFAAGVTAADIEARSGKLLKAAAKAHKELVDIRPFWR